MSTHSFSGTGGDDDDGAPLPIDALDVLLDVERDISSGNVPGALPCCVAVASDNSSSKWSAVMLAVRSVATDIGKSCG